MYRFLTIGILALGLSACATPYQNMGFLGGVSASQITNDTIQVTARGNGFTDPDTVQRFALRKAAEATVNAGYDNFEIISDADRTRKLTSSDAYFGGGYAFGNSYQIIKPGQTFLIKMRHGPVPDNAGANVFDAHEILKFAATSDEKNCKQADGKISCE